MLLLWYKVRYQPTAFRYALYFSTKMEVQCFQKLAHSFYPVLGSPHPAYYLTLYLCQFYPGQNAPISTSLCSAVFFVKNNLPYTTYRNTGNFHCKNTIYLSQQWCGVPAPWYHHIPIPLGLSHSLNRWFPLCSTTISLTVSTSHSPGVSNTESCQFVLFRTDFLHIHLIPPCNFPPHRTFF